LNHDGVVNFLDFALADGCRVETAEQQDIINGVLGLRKPNLRLFMLTMVLNIQSSQCTIFTSAIIGKNTLHISLDSSIIL